MDRKKVDCLGEDTFKSMDLEHTVSAFALVLAAALISLLFLVIEVNLNIN